MNKRQTGKPSLLKGGSIGLVTMMAALLAPMAPEAAAADTSGNFYCRASAVEVNRIEVSEIEKLGLVPHTEPVIANGTPTDGPSDISPCKDEAKAAAERSITDAGITVTTKGASASTDVVEGRQATAEAGVTEYTVHRPSYPGGVLRVQVAHSRASAICDGATATLSGSSKVSSVTLDGVELLPEPVEEEEEVNFSGFAGVSTNPATVDIVLNKQEKWPGDRERLIQTAFIARFVTAAVEVRLGESRIGADTGGASPCGAARPVVSVGDASAVAEGTPGVRGHTQGMARFTVSLSPPSATAVTVNYNTADGSATGSGTGRDYQAATTGSVVFTAGDTTAKVVEVPVLMDSSNEPDEHFFLKLTGASAGVVLANTRAKATIIDDDPTSTATLSVDDVTVRETTVAGTTAEAIFTVTAWPPSAAPFSVRAFTADGTAHPAAPFNDYVHVNQVLEFAPNETTKRVSVTVNGDNIAERDEIFYMALEESTGPTREKRQGVGVIFDDDAVPTFSIDDATAHEGSPDQGPNIPLPARFTVTLSAPSFREISVDYATTDGTTRSSNHSVFGPADYKPVSGRLHFAPGEITKTVEVEIIPDNVAEQEEYFLVRISGAVNVTPLKSVGQGTILMDFGDCAQPSAVCMPK